MLDIKLIREQTGFCAQRLATRGAGDEKAIDRSARAGRAAAQAAGRSRGAQGAAQPGFEGNRRAHGAEESREAEAKKAETREIGDRIAALDKAVAEAEAEPRRADAAPAESAAPERARRQDAEDNPVVRTWAASRSFSFKPKSHIEICESLRLVDFARGAKLSGSGFLLYTNWGAKLERALIQFLLDLHTSEHGYTEVSPPYMVGPRMHGGRGAVPEIRGPGLRGPGGAG